MTQPIAVALSGGIDSLVAAYLLKQADCPIIGLHFLSGYETPPAEKLFKARQSNAIFLNLPADHPLTLIKDLLDIDIRVLDCRRLFKQKIIDYFVNDYLKGLTPNPCMVCNSIIKFGVMLDAARQMGASHLATGHYAICEKSAENRYYMKKGQDVSKDQSYFLAMLNQTQLARAIFPLGGLTKQQVFEIASNNGLSPVSGHESQDICFIKDKHYSQFLAEHAQNLQLPGKIVDINGKRLGMHQGLHNFTIGQRRGINCPSTEPYYVIRLDTARNQLVVGFKKDLYQYACKMYRMNWVIENPETPVHVMTKIRYRHEPAESILLPTGKNSATIEFSQPQPAVTPGQAAVCYQGDRLVAAGWIYQ